MSQRVYLFDTTLRDGEQSPGASLQIDEKIQIARQLAKLGVDIIEAGFPITSPGDFEAVSAIAREVKGVTIAGLSRTHFEDIDRAWEAVRHADQPRIHTFISSSDIHLEHQLRMTREQVLEAAEAAVRRAKSYTSDVEFSAMDASRSDMDFLCQILSTAVRAGATVLNIPDTVGYAVPEEWGRLIRTICERVDGIEKAIISVHCHNDLGLAVANSLAAITNGARQVETTINGIGERAGNAALEELVMILRTRKDLHDYYTRVNTEEIYRTSRMVSNLTGMRVQPNKAIVGKNAFAHESGIHQDGVIKERTTYEIMSPAMVGISKSNLVLGKLSGRHAFRQRLEELGYSLTDDLLQLAFERFKILADKKKDITDADLEAIIEEETKQTPPTYTLNYLHVSSGTTIVPTATIVLRLPDGQLLEKAACGNGPVDAICNAVDEITGLSCTMVNWEIDAVTSGKDALGDVTLRITSDGVKTYVGRGVSTDVLDASALAYVNAVNKMVFEKRGEF